MNILKIFGSNVRRIREQYGWSQDHLADESGLHRTYISGIERGSEILHLVWLQKYPRP